MSLAAFIQTERGQAARLAKTIGVHPVLISQWAAGRPVPVVHCAAIEMATGGVVSRKTLRPDDWQRIWPELVLASGQPGPQQQSNEQAQQSAA